ncbi:hypothetical protein BD560DRAFT_491347 [Blakeslea trispora]|nr:hypothetical protein BD560DRAFT_491347 [Blakeslea trispora]
MYLSLFDIAVVITALLVSDITAAGAVTGSISQGSSSVSPSLPRASPIAIPIPEKSNYISRTPQPSMQAGGSSPFEPSNFGTSGSLAAANEPTCTEAVDNILKNIDQIQSVSYGLANTNRIIQMINQAEDRIMPARSACCLFNFDSEFAKKENAKQVERMEDFVDDLKDMFKESQGSLHSRYNPYYRLNSLGSSLHNLKDCID